MTLSFHNPVATCEVPINQYSLNASLADSATVALVINKIVDCDRFMEHVGQAIAQARPGVRILPFETGRITFADGELMDQVARECDAAICAIGHCGSCTAGTVKDGIALIERGCPSVSLVTEIFWNQANALARSLGWPDAPRIQLPYPIWGVDEKSMKDVAQNVTPGIVKLLESPDVLAA